jgi:hypothetical protein
MRSWRQLAGSARRVDAELPAPRGMSAEVLDVHSRSPLVTVTVGETVPPNDRDRVLRAAVGAALTEIRRLGA